MNKDFNLEEYLANGVENVMKGAIKASFSNPKESLFISAFARKASKANKKREASAMDGNHVPPFLIASVTNRCNLHCAGCYSRAIDSCTDEGNAHDCSSALLSAKEWDKVFDEAEDMGVSFIMLVGGEPLVRQDVIDKAAAHKSILFPVITNGTLIYGEYLNTFDKHRNLFPVISVEGGEETTDDRRGKGIYKLLDDTMANMKDRGILFGASITVTRENLEEVLSNEFVDKLYNKGCKSIFYIEYVPAEPETEHLAPVDEDREYMENAMERLRQRHEDMVLISFPGDENATSGCLAAGRGFFHINANGGAEPCPFSPYSDINIKNVGLRGAMDSPLFRRLQSEHVMDESHAGGCVLYNKQEEVEALLGVS